jgi:tRNA nucleotidyltransferase (CCA-adding enzyme)
MTARDARRNVQIILTHENADFDAIASLLAAWKLNPAAIPILPERQNRNVAHFLALYQTGLPFVRQSDFHPHKVEQAILVDTQRPPPVRGIKPDTSVHIVDHHLLADDLPGHFTAISEAVGAATTLLVEQIQQQGIPLLPLEATLLALGIYEDTGSLVYRDTTPRDLRAAAWLVEQQAALDTVRHFLTPPLTEEQQKLLDWLVSSVESRVIQGSTVMVSEAALDSYMPEISSVAHRLRDLLDPAALFVLVQMPDALQLVCRASEDTIDVGQVARFFGGGGHERAAAATIRDRTLAETIAILWRQVEAAIHPGARVADLMSYGVQTIEADRPVADVVRQMRRIGHEGFPVVENGRLVGLLTRRDADRAVEHNLGDLKVRAVMSGGTIAMRPDDPVSSLEQRMVDSGWGQIPVVDDSGKIIGVVTRTDLIKYWARTHPARRVPQMSVTLPEMESILGKPVAGLIERIAWQAQDAGVSLYMVGGSVRDLLLKRPNLDIDFVVEGNAIDFAHRLQKELGGQLSSYRPFGTATWTPPGPNGLPDHLDFATARNEFYEHPTALPTVYSGSIKLDLLRRDFTINTLAVQVSPAAAFGRVLDFYGGLNDLQAGIIRALHSLSFVDDPTRILRAARFESRLGFQIEPRTAELIQTALPMLRRITGERVRNEMTLLLRENQPERGLLALQSRGALEAIHPAFRLDSRLSAQFERARNMSPPWPMEAPEPADLYWHILACGIPMASLADWCERLLFGKTMGDSLGDAARFEQNPDELRLTRPSQIVARLDGISEVALLTVWLIIEADGIRANIRRYAAEWRHVRASTTGHTLRELGMKPGPCYRLILERLRDARLDGEVTSDAEENRLLQALIDGGFCDEVSQTRS